MAHHLYLALSHFFDRYGYWAILITVFLENTGFPAPGDTVVLFAGFLSRRGGLSLTWTIAIALIAAILGQCLGFLIGRLGGRAFAETYRRKLFISQRHYERAQDVFLRNAGWAVFVARFIIVLRELAGLLSGAFRFPFGRFLLSNIAGAIVWSVSMGCLGYFLSESWRRLLHVFSRVDLAAGIAFGVAILVLVVRYWMQGRKKRMKIG